MRVRFDDTNKTIGQVLPALCIGLVCSIVEHVLSLQMHACPFVMLVCLMLSLQHKSVISNMWLKTKSVIVYFYSPTQFLSVYSKTHNIITDK